MLKFFVLALVLALARSHDPEDFEGKWTTLKVYPSLPVRKECTAVTIKLTEATCKCGEINAAVFNIQGNDLPVIVVQTEEEAMSSINKRCFCNRKNTRHSVFRRLEENYMLVYVSDHRFSVTGIVAKTVPTASEFERLESSIDELKDKRGTVICTKDSKHSGHELSQDTDTMEWTSYLKSSSTSNDVE